MSENELNPFASPQTVGFSNEKSETPEEAQRSEYLSHETSVTSLSLVFFILGTGYMVFAVAVLVGYVQTSGGLKFGIPGGVFLIGIALFAIAIGLRMLWPIARIGASTFAVLGLIGFPFLTIICAYILFLFWSRNGQVVFSSKYRAVIDATPHVKNQLSLVAKAIMWLVLLVMALAFVA